MAAVDAQTGNAAPDQAISDAYIYLLGRQLITRQQQIDFDKEGFVWNRLLHRKPGAVDWPNPNLDVAYSKAWVALDEASFLLVIVPEIQGRYYVVEFLNGWGETVGNINERVFPGHPNGLFAVCLEGAKVDIPPAAARLDVPVRHMRVLLRVELGKDWDEAIALQHQFRFEIRGSPTPPAVPRTPMFDIEALPGVAVFEAATLALDSEADINPGMEPIQATARAIAEAVKDPAERARVEAVIQGKALHDFAAAAAVIGRGKVRNGWGRAACCGHFGDDWLTRTVVNFGGIWANVFEEVIYYKGMVDSGGARLDPTKVYTLTFPADDLPSKYATYFWSIIAVDSVHRRVLPNPLNRFLLNNQSDLRLGEDGSLTLYFAAERPADAPEGNWLPTIGQSYSFTLRFYGPRGGVADGVYFPPPIVRR
jgi:hypothetical protein